MWASRLLGDPLPERVTGIDLMFRLLELAQERGYRVFILGAKEDVLATAVARLEERYPGLVVAGSHHGYFTDDESPEICSLVRATKPHILLVAMSSPPQGVLARGARRRPRRSLLHGRRRLDRRRRRPHKARAGVDAAHGARVVLPVRAGAAPAGPRYLRTNLRFAGLLARELVSGRRRPR